MAGFSQVIAIDSLRSLAAASIGAAYSLPIGTGFAKQMRIVHIVNNTDADLTLSVDTVNDNLFIPSGGFLLYDGTTNRVENLQVWVFRQGTTFYPKGSPTTGSIYVMALYGAGE